MKNVLKCIGWVVLNLILQFMVQFIFSMCIVVSGTMDNVAVNEMMMNNILATTIISNLLFVVAAMLISKIQKVKVKEEWKLENNSVKAYILPCVIAFFYSMFYTLITYDSTLNSTSVTHSSAVSYGIFGIPVLALALLISAPVTEEIMCRGIMMNTLKRSFSSGIAIIISSAIFGMIHIMAGGVSLAIGAFVMGLVFAIIYEKTNSLFIAIVAHAVANLPEFIFYASPQINDVLRITLAALFLGISGICLFVWCKQKNDTSN